MRTQGIDLRDSRHGSHKGASHASPGAHQIPVLHRFPHQLLGDDIHHRKSVLDDGIQLPLQALFHHGRQIGTIDLMGSVIADSGQGLVTVFNDGGTLVRPHGRNAFAHIRDHIGVFHHDLVGLVTAQVRELLQHLLCRMKIQRRLLIRILEALARHDDTAVDLVLGVQEMHITGGHHRLVELFAQLHDSGVELLNILHGIHIANLLGVYHELIVPAGLHLQIVIEIHQPGYLHIALSVQQRAVQLSRLAGASQDQPLPVLHHETLGNPGMSTEIGQMGL